MLTITAVLALPRSPSSAVEVFSAGESGFPCIRAPTTIQAQDGVILAFAAGRCFTGDNCFPKNKLPGAKNYSAHIVKRSIDGGKTWGKMVEIHRNSAAMGCAKVSTEGASLFDTSTNTTISMWNTNIVGNSTTNSTLWQSESPDAGLTWTTPHSVAIPELTAEDYTKGSHFPPSTGIQLHNSSKHPGRLMVVLILKNHCREDVVLYSDNSGKDWQVSNTRIENNGEGESYNAENYMREKYSSM